jgi:hypothetical protein
MSVDGRIVQSDHYEAAEWIAERLAPSDAWNVWSIIPTGFDAYVRVFHPTGEGKEGLTWRQLADRYGRVMHAHAEFERLVPPDERPYVGDPPVGFMWPELTATLAELVAPHTSAADQCWFCLWDGWGWVQGPPAIGILVSAPENERQALVAETQRRWQPQFRLDGGRVILPGRNYLLFEGPLASVPDFGYWTEWPDGRRSFDRESPNIWWPEDLAWCVATEIDLDSTYVGGSERLIADLLSDPRVEAMRVRADDDCGDTINPPFDQ